MTTIGGFQVIASQLLIGSKIAVKQFGKIYVSPAMYDLMKAASPLELEALVRSIKVRDLDSQPVHDCQWMLDTFQICIAASRKVAPPVAPEDGGGR